MTDIPAPPPTPIEVHRAAKVMAEASHGNVATDMPTRAHYFGDSGAHRPILNTDEVERRFREITGTLESTAEATRGRVHEVLHALHLDTVWAEARMLLVGLAGRLSWVPKVIGPRLAVGLLLTSKAARHLAAVVLAPAVHYGAVPISAAGRATLWLAKKVGLGGQAEAVAAEIRNALRGLVLIGGAAVTWLDKQEDTRLFRAARVLMARRVVRRAITLLPAPYRSVATAAYYGYLLSTVALRVAPGLWVGRTLYRAWRGRDEVDAAVDKAFAGPAHVEPEVPVAAKAAPQGKSALSAEEVARNAAEMARRLEASAPAPAPAGDGWTLLPPWRARKVLLTTQYAGNPTVYRQEAEELQTDDGQRVFRWDNQYFQRSEGDAFWAATRITPRTGKTAARRAQQKASASR